MRIIHEFQIEHNNIELAVAILFIEQSILYRIKFNTSRPSIFITKATDINEKEFWTSIPEGRQKEAELLSKLIDCYLQSKDGVTVLSKIKKYEKNPLDHNVDPDFIFLNFPDSSDVLFAPKLRRANVATINGSQGLNSDANFFWIIEGYKLGFNNLLNDFVENRRNPTNYCDIYVYPALFCLRHFIELILKDTIRKFKIGFKIIKSNQIGFKATHDILKLFQQVVELIQTNPPKFTAEIMKAEFPNQLRNVKKLIIELSSADTHSETFRYPFKRARKGIEEIEIINEELSIDLLNLRSVGNKIIYILECIHSEAWAICSKNTANSLSPDPSIDNLGF